MPVQPWTGVDQIHGKFHEGLDQPAHNRMVGVRWEQRHRYLARTLESKPLQPSYQISLDGLWFVARCIALEHCTIGTNKELREVPFDRFGAQQPRLF